MQTARTYLGECAHYAVAERILRRAAEAFDAGTSYDEAIGLDEELRSYFDKPEFALDTPEYQVLAVALAEVAAAEEGDGYDPEEALAENYRRRIASDWRIFPKPRPLPTRYLDDFRAAYPEGWSARFRTAADHIAQMSDAEMLRRTQAELARQRSLAEKALQDLERDYAEQKARFEGERRQLAERVSDLGESLSYVAEPVDEDEAFDAD